MTICIDRNLDIKEHNVMVVCTTCDANMFEVYYKIYRINCMYCVGILFVHMQHVYKICFLIETV